MLFYIFFYFFIILISCIRISRKDVLLKQRRMNFQVLIPCICVALFLGLRNNIGIDDQMHVAAFEQINQYGSPWRDIEFSYIFICKVVQSLNGTIQIVYLIYAFASCLLLYYVVNELVDPLLYSIFWGIFLSYMLFTSLTLMRQFLAVMIVTTAYVKAKKGCKKTFLSLFLLAVFIHTSSLVFIVLWKAIPAIRKIKKSSKILTLIILFIYQYFPISNIIQSFVINSSLDKYRYISYYLGSQAGYRIYSSPLGVISTLHLLVFIIMLCYKKENDIGVYNNDKCLFNNVSVTEDLSSFAFLYFSLSMLLAPFGSLVRIGHIFSIFAICYLCKFVEHFKKSDIPLIKFIGVICFSLLFMYSVFSYSPETQSGASTLIPYSYNTELFSSRG